jgi:16S rRNA (guanine527-N7)-methyltransferase
VSISVLDISRLLQPFELALNDHQLQITARYLDLLMRWNRAVNLTAVRLPEQVVTRHFGESLYVTKFAALDGSLLDVGSGAGFPGLAIKILRPDTAVVLLEPVAKKRAFLKEVVRECQFCSVEVKGARVEDFNVGHVREFESVTLRAVGDFGSILPAVHRGLTAKGRLYTWLTSAGAMQLKSDVPEFCRLFSWSEPITVPLSRGREIWTGSPKAGFDVKTSSRQ